ncbi:serine/threonine-protein kinase [Amycolatopsis sp. VS8301801F10]|uniref:serine/threonine-protein kinase n=1 Tax=Amycolatopsis sp. VS8301801F10 TaxID=2652442 RepID=UPI0038FD35E3
MSIGVGEERLLAEGPVAKVYAGRLAGADVAVKVFDGVLDRDTAARFDRERKALAAVRGERAILPVDEAGELPGGRLGLRMELCPRSLAQLLDGQLPVRDVLAVGWTVSAALAAAHQVGVVHGGVTPHNVLLRRSGELALADFGLALRRRFPRDPLHAVDYAAPETLRDDALSEASDLYGLGAVLYTALTGSSPFPRHTGQQRAERILQVFRDPVPPIRVPAAPPALTDLIGRLLAKDPADRPQDPAAVAETLERLYRASAAPAEVEFDDFAGMGATAGGFGGAPPQPGYGAQQPVGFGGAVPPPGGFAHYSGGFGHAVPQPSGFAAPQHNPGDYAGVQQAVASGDTVRAGGLGGPVQRTGDFATPQHQPAGLGNATHQPTGLGEPAQRAADLTTPQHQATSLGGATHHPTGLGEPAQRAADFTTPQQQPLGLGGTTQQSIGLGEPAQRTGEFATPHHQPAGLGGTTHHPTGLGEPAQRTADPTTPQHQPTSLGEAAHHPTGLGNATPPPPAPAHLPAFTGATPPPSGLSTPPAPGLPRTSTPGRTLLHTFDDTTPPARGRKLSGFAWWPALAAGLAAAVGALVAVPMLTSRQDPGPAAPLATAPSSGQLPPAGRAPAPDVHLALAAPADLGTQIKLSWSAEGNLDFAVVVGAERLAPMVLVAHRDRTMSVPVDPARKYCFQIRATDGSHVYETPPVPVRGAVCTT